MTTSLPFISDHVRIDGIVPGVRGQRAFPSPGLRDADPFLMLDHIGPGALPIDEVVDGAAHPHRGFETVSIFLNGSLDHVDSMGNRLRIGAGDLQVMNAGRGIIHGGDMRPDPDTGIFQEFQLWVNLPASMKMSEPTVQNVSASVIPVFTSDGIVTRVLSGTALNLKGPARTRHPTTILHSKLAANTEHPAIRLPATYRVLCYLLNGQVSFGGSTLRPFQCMDLGIPGAGDLAFTSGSEGAEYLLLAGEPLREPVVFGGPFVMNTQTEIDQAQSDYKAGVFGEVIK
ncbi:MAG: pirin family protein [Kofleriaceae bacterium]|nr:pirin family protein [Kofleriaceae bacterium]